MKIKYSLFLFLLLAKITIHAQFQLNGNAQASSSDCYRLTEAENFQLGSIWSLEKINLNESFEVIADLFLGCSNGGADGIVFGFQPVSNSLGQAGGGIGFLGITPSLGIEFDTYQNGNLYNDPSYDHMALQKNGNLSHSSTDNLFGPVNIITGQDNVEDCTFHELQVSWDAELFILKIYVDCELRIQYTGDIVNDIFGGDPEVFWGFTSATGAANNVHEICFTYTTFLDAMPDIALCPGGQIQLQASGGLTYSWSPALGLSATDIPNPIASPESTTNYTVEISDPCGRIIYDEVLITVEGEAVDFDIGMDTMLCEGELLLFDATTPNLESNYLWSNGSTDSILTVLESGTYTVTVININCIATDMATVDFVLLPKFDFGRDTILCLGEKTILDATSDRATYLWQDQTYFPTYVVIEAGTYSVYVENECASKEEFFVVEYEDCLEVYIPNAFSPNSDLNNDFFIIYAGDDVEIIHNLQIFDRWGTTLFSTFNFSPNDERHGWDGRLNGKDLPSGVYAYTLTVLFTNGEQKTISGDVTLLR